jgi:hypothetical protein
MGSDNRALIDRIRAAYELNDPVELAKATDELAADDFVQEWPQSGERLSLEAFRKVNESYEQATGTAPKFSLRRILGEGDVYVIEGTIDYGNGVPVSYVGILEVHDGKIKKLTDYFANPFEAPAWRAHLVERMAPVAV